MSLGGEEMICIRTTHMCLSAMTCSLMVLMAPRIHHFYATPVFLAGALTIFHKNQEFCFSCYLPIFSPDIFWLPFFWDIIIYFLWGCSTQMQQNVGFFGKFKDWHCFYQEHLEERCKKQKKNSSKKELVLKSRK